MADAKTKTVIDDMSGREIFATKELAANYIARCMTDYADFGEHPIVTPVDLARGVEGLGQDDAGNLVFDAELFPDDMEIMIAVLTQRGEGAGSQSSVKAITISPVPSFANVLADDKGKEWLNKIFETEINRTAVRQLRGTKTNPVDVTDQSVLAALPRTLADYVTSNRGGASTVFEAFEDNWKVIKTALGKMSKAWKLANLNKREFKNAMSSAAYASQYYPTLEEAKTGSLFVFALRGFAQLAEQSGKDASIFQTWLNTRDSYEIEDEDENEEEEISFDALSASFAQLADDTDEAEAPADATSETAEG